MFQGNSFFFCCCAKSPKITLANILLAAQQLQWTLSIIFIFNQESCDYCSPVGRCYQWKILFPPVAVCPETSISMWWFAEFTCSSFWAHLFYSTVKLLVSREDFISFKLFKKLVHILNVFLRDDEKAMQKFLPVTGLVFRYLKANHADFSLTSPVPCLRVPYMPAFCIEYTSSPINSSTHTKETKLRLLSVLHMHFIFVQSEGEWNKNSVQNTNLMKKVLKVYSLCSMSAQPLTWEPTPQQEHSDTCFPVTVLLCWSHYRLWGWCLFVTVLRTLRMTYNLSTYCLWSNRYKASSKSPFFSTVRLVLWRCINCIATNLTNLRCNFMYNFCLN